MALTFEDIMERDKKETLDYHNFDDWHRLDFKPKIINFLEIESLDSDHGKMVRDAYKLVAPPNSNAYLGNMRYRVSGDEIIMCDIKYYDSYIPIGQFVEQLNIHIIGASLSNPSTIPQPLINYLKTLPVIYVGSAGNDGSEGIDGKFRHLGFMSGAIYLRRTSRGKVEIKKESYSAIGELMDFATLHSWGEGTSFSQPVLAGMNAWIMSKYGVMTQSKMKEVLISICIDAGEEGKDSHFGYGVPILPIDGIIKRLEGIDAMIDNNLYTVDEIIEKLKNYDKTEFHIHHTWKPNINDFTSSNHIALQNAMRSYHMGQRNFEDIAQHITQFPDGKFMVGRNFSWTPASSKGYRPNGNPWNNTAVFMVENIGNFDKEEIPKIMWDNLIKIAAYFQSIGGKFFFHRQMDASKSCPGRNFRYK